MDRTLTQNAEEQLVQIPTDSVVLEGNLDIPEEAKGVVLFAHGSGSSRHSSRNQFVAQSLRDEGLATLLFDLLTSEEEAIDVRTRHLRFDIDLLARRLVGATDWLRDQPEAEALNIGYFGASTGAAAALIAASERPDVVGAVVSRGGRPDLAGSALAKVEAPTMLIVGANDLTVLDLNLQAMTQLHMKKKIEIVPGASHLFEEPGALEEVAWLANRWFRRHLNSTDATE